MSSVLAVRKVAPRPGAEIQRVELGPLGPHEVRLRVEAASICGTDRHVFAHDAWAAGRLKTPLTIGHECAGTVIEIGDLVDSVGVGDLVSVETHLPCQRCRECLTGQMHVCRRVKILGLDVDGCFAEQVTIPEICAWRNPKGMDPRLAAIQEPFGNAVYCVETGNVGLKTVAILGDGPIACFATAICRAWGAARVVVAGISPARLEIARTMGAHRVIDARSEDTVASLLADSGGEGFDVVMEMAGVAKTVNQGLAALRRRGTFVAFGIPPGAVSVDYTQAIVFKEARVIGLNGRRMFDTWYQTRALIAGGLVDPTPVITHAFPLDRFADAFALLDDPAGGAGKVVLLPQS